MQIPKVLRKWVGINLNQQKTPNISLRQPLIRTLTTKCRYNCQVYNTIAIQPRIRHDPPMGVRRLRLRSPVKAW